MARVRSSPRAASRHTGLQWNASRQFEFAGYKKIPFGPFQAIRPDLLDEREALSVLKRAVTEAEIGLVGIRNSRAVPLTYSPDGYPHIIAQAGTVTDTILGIANTYVKSEPYHIFFVEDATTGKLDLHIYDGTNTKTEVTSGYASTGASVDFIFWGDSVYFIQQGTARLIIVDFINGSLTTVAPTTAPVEFIFLLDNNLCLITQGPDDSPKLWWHRDSAPMPTDGGPAGLYAGGSALNTSGSGNYLINTIMGDVTGVGQHNNAALINCRNGAFTVNPTGTLPAFRFSRGDSLSGTRAVNATSTGSTGVAYVGSDGYCYLHRGGQAQRVGTNPPRFDITSSTIRVVFLKTLNAWAVWNVPTNGPVRLWLLDADALDFFSYVELPSRLNNLSVLGELSFAESSPGAGDDFTTIGFFSDYDSTKMLELTIPFVKEYTPAGGGGAANMEIESHELQLGAPCRILYADVQLRQADEAHITSGDLRLFVKATAVTGMNIEREENAVVINHTASVTTYRFALNVICDLLSFRLEMNLEAHPFYTQPPKIIFTIEPVDAIHESLLNV